MGRVGPLVLKPYLAERVWGGDAFGSGIGEASDLSVHPNGPCKVVGGPHDGATLAEVVAADLDAFGGPIDLLAFHEVARGDSVFVPAGTVRAIGRGLRLFELQQSADTTFRLFDYGRGRDLHLDQGLEVADLGPSTPTRGPTPLSDGHRLVSCPHFHVDEVTGTNITIDPGDRWQALLELSGSATTGDKTAPAGTTLLVPAAAGPTSVHGPCNALRYGPGPG